MGNQNTSGMLGDEEAKEEDRVMVQESAAEGEEVEGGKGGDEGSDETGVETKGSDLGEGGLKMSDEEQEQACNFTSTDSVIQQEQNVLMEEALEVDGHDAEMALEGVFSEARPRDGDLERDDDDEDGSPQEEQSISIETINEAPQITLLDSSYEYCSHLDHEEEPTINELSEDEAKNECPSPDHEEKKPMINEAGNGDDTNSTSSTICVDQEIESGDLIIEAEIKENGDENGETDRHMLEKALDKECEPSPTESGHETETEAAEKCATELRSSEGIDTSEVETPPITTEGEATTNSSPKLLETEANQSSNGAKVELRKSPSFDFGISFDTRSQDSDQTPLLYQDKTARRSLSTCSNLSFETTGIQKEYAAKTLQFEAIQVEEKTILMETPPQVIKNIQENDTNASPSKGNTRRKTRSSLFTTCICCTAAIS